MSDDIAPQESAPEAAESTSMDLDNTPASSEPAGGVPQTAATETATPLAGSPYDAFKQLPQFEGQDDQAIAANLYQAMQREQAASHALRQYQQVMPVAQEYLANRQQFEAWKSAQSQQQQAPQQQSEGEPGWWNPPQLTDAHKRYLVKDANGRDAIAENAPLDAQAALSEWMGYRADFAQKFLANPEEALGPMVQELAQKQAQELIENTMTQRDNESFVSQVEEENKDWLFDQETGNVSPAGLLVHKYIEQAKSNGINGPKARWSYAVAMTERDMLAQRFDEGQMLAQQHQEAMQQPVEPEQPLEPSPQEQAQKNMEYLRKEAGRNPSRSSGAANADPRQPKPKRTFEQMLLDEANSKHLI